jgi:hypothetical protein
MDNVNRGEETGSFDECAGQIFSWIAGPESHPGRNGPLYVLIRNKLTEEAWNDHLELVDRTS